MTDNAALRTQVIAYHGELLEDLAAHRASAAEWGEGGPEDEVEFELATHAAELVEGIANRLSAILKDTRKVPVTIPDTFTTDRDADDN